jgi:hypothetical protein
MTTRCKGCGQEIIWIKTRLGKKMPLDTETVWVLPGRGGSAYFLKSGTIIYGQKVGDAYDNDDPDSNLIECHESHFATCKKANDFRNKGAGQQMSVA